jgi:hypothetical protein
MREFTDRDGTSWTATVRSRSGPDYKGRHYFVMRSADNREVELTDVRWNSEQTASRTLETMSVAELRRRLRSAVGRAASPIPR